MRAGERDLQRIAVRVESIGGIGEAELEVSPGVTVLTGRNATNRTSFLRAMMAALGSDHVSLKGDADEGGVELTIGDATYTRVLTRENGTVATGGDPYLDDATVADLFAFLLESNEARRAVARGDDLHDLIMRPIDTAAVQADIEQLENERRQVDSEIDDLNDLKRQLPDLEDERARLDSRIADKREKLAEKEAELDAVDRDVDETREEKATLEGKLDELHETRSELENARYDIDTHEESIAALREEHASLEDEYEQLSAAPMGERNELDPRIERLREREERLDAELGELQSIVQFNEDMLQGNVERLDSFGKNTPANGDDAVTDRLLTDGNTTCWTCGTEVPPEQIERTVERLGDLREDTLDERKEVRNELEDLLERKNTLEDEQHERERLERRLDRLDDELDDHESALADLKRRRERLIDEIERLEGAVEQLENEEYTQLLDLHREANQLEFELDQLESDRDDTDEEIADIERRLDRHERLETRRADLQSELEDLRTRIERIETGAIEEFNEHIGTVLELLDYENIERIWLERVERQARTGHRAVDESRFELHVVRTTRSGTAYEDTIDHLSESEREVTGLVFALAGYLVHDLHETVPVMLLDSLEAVDSDRIATLVDYFEEYVDYLAVALLPEDATALDRTYQRVADI